MPAWELIVGLIVLAAITLVGYNLFFDFLDALCKPSPGKPRKYW